MTLMNVASSVPSPPGVTGIAPASRETANAVRTAATLTCAEPMPTARTMIRTSANAASWFPIVANSEQPPSVTHRLDCLAFEVDESELDSLRGRPLKQACRPVHGTVGEFADPVGGSFRAKDEMDYETREHHGDQTDHGSGNHLVTRVRRDRQQCDGRYRQGDLHGERPYAGCDDRARDEDVGKSKGREHLVGHADRHRTSGGYGARDRGRGLDLNDAVPESKSRQRRLVRPDSRNLAEDRGAGDGHPPPHSEIAHASPCARVARELWDHAEDDEGQEPEAQRSTEKFLPCWFRLCPFRHLGRGIAGFDYREVHRREPQWSFGEWWAYEREPAWAWFRTLPRNVEI